MINCFFSLRPYSTMKLFPLNYTKKQFLPEQSVSHTEHTNNVIVFCPMVPDIRKNALSEGSEALSVCPADKSSRLLK
jgi:hypothetical protein